MTNDDIIRMAREAGLGTALCHNSIDGDRIWIEGADWHEEVERFAARVAAAEREAIIQKIPGGNSVDPQWVCDMIRARGQE